MSGKFLESPILLCAVVAVGTYLAWPQVKAALGIKDPVGNHSGIMPMVLDPFGIMKGAQASQVPVPGADRQQRPYRQYEARGDFDTGGARHGGARHGCARDANPADPDDLGCGWRRGAAPGEREEPYPEIRDCGNGIRSTHCQWHRGGR